MIPLDKPLAPQSPLSREEVRVNSADNTNIARPKLKGDTDSIGGQAANSIRIVCCLFKICVADCGMI